MGRRSRRQVGAAPLVAAVAVVVALAGCGAGTSAVEAAQSGPDPAGPTTAPGATRTAPVPSTSPSSSTTIVVTPDGDPGGSLVDGLDARELQEALTTPPTERARSVSGPVAEVVTLSDGTGVWRVRIPGSFPARDARAVVAVDGGDIGAAASPPTGDALVVVATTADGLVPGAEVTYRWGGDDPIPAGPLVVVG